MRKIKLSVILIVVLMQFQCKQTYNPPSANVASGYLVVDGFISAGGDSTMISLSRTKDLSDTSRIFVTEKGASVTVTGQNGETFPLAELAAGKYFAAPLTLNQNESYGLKITTTNNEVYQSDFVPVRLSPVIDSINWVRSTDGVTIYANSHDDNNNTKYYRWEYAETWEYQAAFNSGLIYANGVVYPRPADQQVFTCWRTDSSTELLLATTVKLSRDVINEFPLLQIPDNAQQLNNGYSILVKQYALTADAFAYWQAQKLNTEQLGSIFGNQPSQPTSNIHSITRPNEPVIGYISVSSIQEQRIFIDKNTLPGWVYVSTLPCLQTDTTDPRKNLKDLIGNIVVSQIPMDPGIYLFTSTYCGDCTTQGGVTVKPSFWPY